MRLKAGILAGLAVTFLASTSEPGLESKDIQVTLTADAVKLSGSVVSADDRDKAVRISRSHAGDREV